MYMMWLVKLDVAISIYFGGLCAVKSIEDQHSRLSSPMQVPVTNQTLSMHGSCRLRSHPIRLSHICHGLDVLNMSLR